MDTEEEADTEKHEKMFVYLASSHVTAKTQKKTENVKQQQPQQLVYIGRSSHPFPRLLHHNRVPGHTEGPKETKAGAPWWQLDLILGPFHRGTHNIQKEWRERTRGHRARLLRGLEIGLREQQRLKRQIVWYNDRGGGGSVKTPHPSRTPSPATRPPPPLPDNSSMQTMAGNSNRN